jgi:hypothetical protein
MRTMRSTQSVYGEPSVRRKSIQLYLLLAAAALVLVWLTVGTGPSTWGLLLQVIIHLNGLWAQQGVGALGVLMLLFVQSLLLLAAWLLFILIAVGEISRLYTILPENERPALVLPALLSEAPTVIQPGLMTAVPSPYVSPVFPPAQSPQIEPPAAHYRPGTYRKTRIGPVEQGSQVEQTAYMTGVTQQNDIMPSLDALRSLDWQEAFPVAPDYTELSFPQQEHLPEQGREEEQTKTTSDATSVSDHAANDTTPLNVHSPYEVTNVYKQLEQGLDQEPHLVPEERGDGGILNDPFAVYENAIETMQHEKPVEEAKAQLKPKQPAKEQDQEFVFGNPFEGPLPDVFEHDVDLKRSLVERESNSRSEDTSG